MVTLEDAESRLPLLFHRLRLWTDSGGAGRLRGGLGYEAQVEWRGAPITATLRRERMRFVPQGLAGGGAAPPCRTSFAPRGEPPRDLPGKIDVAMRAGDVLHYWTTGGAGREDASTRDPQRVLDDVLDGRVSPERARDSYRVVVTDGRIDHDATRLLRASARPAQGPARTAPDGGADPRDDH
jgi:N-methylhydantoinase B